MMGCAMIEELVHAIPPGPEGKRYLAIFTFKFDESHKKARSFVVAGWLGEERHWKRVEKLWQKAVAYENKSLPRDRRISRYHAAQMNANDGEFEGWEKENNRKLRFTKKLLSILGKSRLSAIACGIDLATFLEMFPIREPSDYALPYLMCMKDLMNLIGDGMKKLPPDHRVAMIHDHGDWDSFALQIFNGLIDNPHFAHKHRFVSITPLNWREDVGLQAADLIAYELMRRLDDRLWTGKEMRIPLREIMRMNKNIVGYYLGKQALEEFQRTFDDHVNTPDAKLRLEHK